MAAAWIVLIQFISIQLCTGNVINIALNKPANMSSYYGHGTQRAEGAVDGNTAAQNPTIIHTLERQAYAWWTVDLQRDVHDAEVKIYFRTDYKNRRNGLQIYISTTPFSSYPGGQLCHNITGRPNGSDIADIYSVNCSGVWRYLMIYTQTANDGSGALLDFGEVEVLTCMSDTYGPDCALNCADRKCSDATSSCDHITGQCEGGCKTGWNGTDCRQTCRGDTYGANCTLNCGDRKCSSPTSSCDHIIGQCEGGCSPGWNGTDCKQKCPAGSYGENCDKLCRSRQCVMSDENCDRVTGGCPADECEIGWMGIDCTNACPSGRYGPDCNFTCGNCTGADICHHVTGNCPGDCEEGWQGRRCSILRCRQDQTGEVSATSITPYVVGTGVGFGVSIVVVCGILLILHRCGRLKWLSSREYTTRSSEIGDLGTPRAINQTESGNPQLSSSPIYNNDYSEVQTTADFDHSQYEAIRNTVYTNL